MDTRRVSKVIMGGGNPLTDAKGEQDAGPERVIESIAGSHVIKPSEFRDMFDVLEAMDDNKARIYYIAKAKLGFLFNCKQLHDFVMITESLKTRIAFIDELCPRVTDPQTMSQAFVDMFRFEDDRAKVESAFRARLDTLKANQFNAKGGSALSGGGRGAGRGGAGRGGAAGRGAGATGGGRGASSAATPTPAIKPIGIQPAISPVSTVKPTVPIRAAAASPSLGSRPEADEDRPSEYDFDPDEARDIAKQLAVKPATTPANAIQHIPHRKSTTVSQLETDEEMRARIAMEILAAEKEAVVELTPEERRKKAQINLVMAALDLKPSDFAKGAFAELEMWELSAMEQSEEERIENAARNLNRVAVQGRKAALSLGSDSEFDNLTENDVNRPTTKLLPWEKAQLEEENASIDAADTCSQNPATPPSSLPRRASASSSAPLGTPMEGGSKEMIVEEMPEAGVLNKMKAQFENKSYAEVTTPVQKSGARNIFSPTRISNSPAGSVTPPPNPLKANPSIQNALSENVGVALKAFEGGVEVEGVKYSNTQLELAKQYATAANLDYISFLALSAGSAVEKGDQGEDLFSYKELLRKHFAKKYDSCDPKRLEYFLAEKDFQLVFNMTKLEWEKMPAWKKLAKRQSSLLF